MPFPLDDKYQVSVIEKVTKESDNTWILKSKDGYSLWVEGKDVDPQPGDTAIYYGDGFGRPVRGVEIVGKGVIYYRTEEEETKKWADYKKKQEEEKQKDFEDHIDERNAQIASLPAAFIARITHFQNAIPTWRRDYEPYELFVCTEAVKIGSHFKTVEELDAWYKLSPSEQQEVLECSDEHSGNTFGSACLLAKFMIMGNDEAIIKYHGALCPLVGCKDYGCSSTYPDA